MKKFLIAAVAIISLSAFTTFQKKQKVVFFGDSITQAGVKEKGYITVLADLLSKSGAGANFELSGAGVSGNKVYDLYLRIEEDVMAKSPDVVIIWVGVNDVWHKQSSGTGTDADKFERFYNAIIKKLQAKNINVMLCTPAAIGERTDFTNQLDGDLNRYSTIIRNIASKTNCKLIDLRRVFLDYNLKNNAENKESGILTTDRVHLNDAGNLVVAQEMMKALTGK
ncbi:MAG: G-D-S-L family lipolytic protein [Gemmatimonadaceae bacterium]|nr:G-D-S-L family lipolytic protein [Chitinophagaceae bacterium]